MGVSLGLHFSGKKREALFVGQWVAPFLLLGIYNELVEQPGSDAQAIEEAQSKGIKGSVQQLINLTPAIEQLLGNAGA
jgi:hypothetical protein